MRRGRVYLDIRHLEKAYFAGVLSWSTLLCVVLAWLFPVIHVDIQLTQRVEGWSKLNLLGQPSLLPARGRQH